MNLDWCRWSKMNMLQQYVYPGGMKRRTTWGFDFTFSISKIQPKQMFMISGSFGGIETRVEVAGWGATTRRGGRYFSSSTFSFLSSPFLSSISSLPVHLSLSFSFSTFSSLYTSCLRPCLHLTPFHCPYECVTYSLSLCLCHLYHSLCPSSYLSSSTQS